MRKDNKEKITYILLWIILISWTVTYVEAKELFRDYEKSEIIINNYLENKEQKSQEGNKGNPDEVKASTEVAPQVDKEVETSLSAEERIRRIARQEGFSEIDKLINVAWCESRLSDNCYGEYNSECVNPTNNSYDRGLYQISRLYHPTVTDECAFDLKCSTKKTIELIEKNGWQPWNASKSCWNNK